MTLRVAPVGQPLSATVAGNVADAARITPHGNNRVGLPEWLILAARADKPVDAAFGAVNAAWAWQEAKRLTEGVRGV